MAIVHQAVEKCLQCGTCSASCPLGQFMDRTPRQLIALIRQGKMEDALRSNTIWLCSTCYLCAVRCPAKINIGEFVTSLKQHALRSGYGDGVPYSKLVETYVNLVDRHGRISEVKFMINYLLRTNPVRLLKMIPVSLKFLREGIISLTPVKVEKLGGRGR